MSLTKKEKIIKNIKTESSKIDKKTFKRINDKFEQYWKYLFGLIAVYIGCYLIWLYSVKNVKELAIRNNWNGNKLLVVLSLAFFQGILFSLDGFVTALLKSPFGQMCYAINKAEGISDEKKDYIINKATESNEHCKETLKKFGIITIVQELAKVFIAADKSKRDTDYEHLMVIGYLVPLSFAFLAVWRINRELKKMKKNQLSIHGKQKRVS